MREDLSKVVLTSVYSSAVKALDDHGFVLLLGEPAAGKTTVAAMLAMASIDAWKASTLKLERSAQMTEHWNPEEPKQFFWIDDAFGVTQYESPLVLDWNRIFPKVKAMIGAGARVVLTSRDYIYRRAKETLKESAFPVMHESQVVIDVHDITQNERRQILYNHIKLGKQPTSFRRAIKPFLETIASHPRFTPETARRLGDPIFTQNLVLMQTGVDAFVERQEQFLREVIQGLDKHSQASLALIFMRNGALESPLTLRESESSALARLGGDLGETIKALQALQGSLTVHVKEDGRSIWTFKHPTVGDAYGSLVLAHPELMDIYVEGAPPEKLIATITCGDVGLEGAVIVPAGLYQPVTAKLSSFLDAASAQPGSMASWHAKRTTYRFLAGRCDRAFLKFYMERHAELLERVSDPGLALSASPEVELSLTLFRFGLLPEANRKKFVEVVTQYTVDGADGYALQKKEIRAMFTPEEIDHLRARLLEELLPNLGEARSAWADDYDGDDDPESHMEPFLEFLAAIESEFPGDSDVAEAVDAEIESAQEWVAEVTSDAEEGLEASDFGEAYEPDDYSPAGASSPERSVFEDIDE
jgi:hypothetical protein